MFLVLTGGHCLIRVTKMKWLDSATAFSSYILPRNDVFHQPFLLEHTGILSAANRHHFIVLADLRKNVLKQTFTVLLLYR